MFYTYILYSENFDLFYIGQTNNLDDRISRHNQNRNKWTKNKGPWAIVFSKSFPTRAQAVQLEIFLKALKNRTALVQWINDNTTGQ